MSVSYNRRKKEIKRHKWDVFSTTNLFGGVYRYRFDGKKWTLEKAKRLRGTK